MVADSASGSRRTPGANSGRAGPRLGHPRARRDGARQRGAEIEGGREAVRGQLLQGAEHRGLDVRRDRAPARAERGGGLRHRLGEDRLRVRAGEGRLAHEHLVHHAGERVDVAARGEVPLAGGLLRAHVLRGAERDPGLGHAAAPRRTDDEPDAEVGHQRRSVLEQDILRLDIPVDDALAMGVGEGARRFLRDPHRLFHRQLLLAVQPGPEGLALDERHDVEEEAVRLARVEERQDVGMLEPGGEADLVQEALGPEHRAELGMQHLERDPPVVAEVPGQIDRGHAAAPELALETIVVGYGPLEPVPHVVGHGRELYY